MRIILVICISFLLISCTDTDLKKLQLFVGIEVPEDIEVIQKIDNWVKFNGEGYSLRMYKTNDNLTWGAIKNCSLDNFNIIKVKEMSLRFPVLESYINTEQPVCIKLDIDQENAEVVLIQGIKIIHYWAAY